MTWTTQRRSKFGTLAATTAGDGPLVVLIHGVGLRAEAWGAQIATLSQNCRVIAVDMPGHGHSASLTGAPDLADFTDSIVGCIGRTRNRFRSFVWGDDRAGSRCTSLGQG